VQYLKPFCGEEFMAVYVAETVLSKEVREVNTNIGLLGRR